MQYISKCIWLMLLSKLTLHSRYMYYQTLLFLRLELMILVLLVLCSTVSATARQCNIASQLVFIVSIYRIGKRGAMKHLFGAPALLLLLFIDLGQLTC